VYNFWNAPWFHNRSLRTKYPTGPSVSKPLILSFSICTLSNPPEGNFRFVDYREYNMAASICTVSAKSVAGQPQSRSRYDPKAGRAALADKTQKPRHASIQLKEAGRNAALRAPLGQEHGVSQSCIRISLTHTTFVDMRQCGGGRQNSGVTHRSSTCTRNWALNTTLSSRGISC
jgi:hypothetical protein